MAQNIETQRKRLLHYLGDVRSALRMDNWDIDLHTEFCRDEDAHAETWQVRNHTILNIRLEADFFDLDPEKVRNTLVHELTHAAHRDVSILWDDCTLNNDDIPRSHSQSWDGDFHMHMERFVSWVTARIEPTVPLWDPFRAVSGGLPPGIRLVRN